MYTYIYKCTRIYVYIYVYTYIDVICSSYHDAIYIYIFINITYICIYVHIYMYIYIDVICSPHHDGCGKQTPSAITVLQVSFFHTRLLYLFYAKMYRRARSMSVHNFGACKKNDAARWRLPIKKRAWPQNLSEFANVRRHSFGKYQSCAQT